jgi:hypothetical protein
MIWKPCLCARSRGSRDGDSLPDSDNWDTPRITSLFLSLETPDMHDFGNPVFVPGHVGPETGTACLTVTTGTPPRTTTGQITIRYRNRMYSFP